MLGKYSRARYTHTFIKTVHPTKISPPPVLERRELWVDEPRWVLNMSKSWRPGWNSGIQKNAEDPAPLVVRWYVMATPRIHENLS